MCRSTLSRKFNEATKHIEGLSQCPYKEIKELNKKIENMNRNNSAEQLERNGDYEELKKELEALKRPVYIKKIQSGNPTNSSSNSLDASDEDESNNNHTIKTTLANNTLNKTRNIIIKEELPSTSLANLITPPPLSLSINNGLNSSVSATNMTNAINGSSDIKNLYINTADKQIYHYDHSIPQLQY